MIRSIIDSLRPFQKSFLLPFISFIFKFFFDSTISNKGFEAIYTYSWSIYFIIKSQIPVKKYNTLLRQKEIAKFVYLVSAYNHNKLKNSLLLRRQ